MKRITPTKILFVITVILLIIGGVFGCNDACGDTCNTKPKMYISH